MMTPEKQRIAIAETCGYTDIHEEIHAAFTYLWGWKDGKKDILPDYLNSLNAMREATVQVIHGNAFRRRRFYQTLDEITHDQWDTIDATAAQRAEAFLKTIGKWDK